MLPAEADTVLDSEFVGGLTGTSQGGGVTTVSEAPQVSRHCRESRPEWEKMISYMLHLRCSLHHTVRRGFHMIREDQMYNGIKVQQVLETSRQIWKEMVYIIQNMLQTLFTWSICCFNFLIMFVINA